MANEQTTGNLSFNDGFRQVTVNEDPNRLIKWNPLDVGFVDRFLAFQTWVEETFKPRVQALQIDKDKGLDDYKQGTLDELGKELCQAIDDAFLSPVSEAAFAGVNPISPMTNGNFLFINFLNALMPMIEKSIQEFDKARKKYTQQAKGKRSGQ